MSELRERRRAATLRRLRTIECRGGRGSAKNAPTAPPKGQRSTKIFDNFFFFFTPSAGKRLPLRLAKATGRGCPLQNGLAIV